VVYVLEIRRLLDISCNLLRQQLRENHGDLKGVNFISRGVTFLADLAYDTPVKQWLGQNFILDLLGLLSNRAEAAISDAPLRKSVGRLLHNCCARSVRNQTALASILLKCLEEATSYSDFLSWLTSFLLSIPDTIPVMIKGASLAPSVRNSCCKCLTLSKYTFTYICAPRPWYLRVVVFVCTYLLVLVSQTV
jgi:hypothetical protein